MSVDYKSTVYLPKTGFPMKAGLPKREPELLQHWEEPELFRHHRDVAEGREKFILHDGPHMQMAIFIWVLLLIKF